MSNARVVFTFVEGHALISAFIVFVWRTVAHVLLARAESEIGSLIVKAVVVYMVNLLAVFGVHQKAVHEDCSVFAVLSHMKPRIKPLSLRAFVGFPFKATHDLKIAIINYGDKSVHEWNGLWHC